MNPKDRAKKFGQFLKEHRLAAAHDRGTDVSQAEICRALGVSSSTYNRWEQGDSLPSIVYYPALLEYYGEGIKHVLGLARVDMADPDLQELAALWPSLSDGDRAQLLEAARAKQSRAEGGRMFQFAS